MGAEIDLIYNQTDPADISVTLGADDVLRIDTPLADFTVQLSGDYTGDYFKAVTGVLGDAAVVLEGTPCYCPGTLILTDRGEVPVEDLRIGDRLVTVSGTTRPLRWIGRRCYDGRFVGGNRDILPITIRAGALADGVPRRDLTVSPLHAMLLGGVLVPAAALVNSTSIRQHTHVERIDYLHLELETHDVILAEGAASETFVDDGSRGMFHNAREFAQLYPGSRAGEAAYCAPRLEAGEQLDEIRRALGVRASGHRNAA